MTDINANVQSVVLDSGIRLHYARSGQGVPVIFIHGAMGDYRAWTPQWEQFTSGFDCISYSRRYSYPNGNPMNTRQHNATVDAVDLEALMDHLDLPSAVLVGSSYGGFTALSLACQAPDRVSALVSVEAPMMRYACFTEQGAQVANAFRQAVVLPSRAAFEQDENLKGLQILTGGIVNQAVNDIPKHIIERRMQNVEAARSLALSDDEFPLIEPETLSALDMPIMLISGANTAPIHKAIFQNVCQALPQAQVEIVDGSGHGVSQQQPLAFNNLVSTFLSEHGFLTARQDQRFSLPAKSVA